MFYICSNARPSSSDPGLLGWEAFGCYRTAMNIAAPLAPGKYRLRIEDYLGLSQSGSFGAARTELIEGDIIVTAPEYRRHAFAREELTYRLRRALDALASPYFPTSGSISLGEHDMPQPDIVLTREPRGDGPIPLGSIGLLVEIASSTLDDDLGVKAKLYASAAIPEYWVVDVEGRAIHQLWQPEAGAYAEKNVLGFDQPIAAVTLPNLKIETTGL